MTLFDPAKPCCLHADLDKPEAERRKVRILATDLLEEWPICAWTEGLLFAQLYTINGSVACDGDPCGDDLVNIPPAPAPRCEPPQEWQNTNIRHWVYKEGASDNLILVRWDSENAGWEFPFGKFYRPEKAYGFSYRYWNVCHPGPRYGEADPRDVEIERLKVQVSELLKLNKEVGCAAVNLQTSLAAARKIEVTESMIGAAVRVLRRGGPLWEKVFEAIEAALAAREGRDG